MAGQGEKVRLTVPALQAHPLVEQYAPAGLNSGVLRQQLGDPALLYVELDALCGMEDGALKALVRPAQSEGNEVVGRASEDAQEESGEDVVPKSAEECIVLTVDAEGMTARMTLIPPPDGVPEPGTKEMFRVLYKRKISRGLRVEFINRLAERPIYDRVFRIAEAQPTVNGQDSRVEFHFDPSADLSPKVAEDGTVDYKALDFIKSVKAGALLCEITPATPGVDGMNVYGEPIPAQPGRPPQVRCGLNAVPYKGGLEIRAACDGQVFLRDGCVEVSQVLVLDTVDFSTGNIDFPGSVHIRGDVSNGFTVRAGGDIVVNGVVENATLISGGNIALCSGIKGGGTGSLEARQNVRTLFIESCKARAGGNIYADTILNSTVACGQLVSVCGKRGYLLGGVCVAGDAVSAVQIGNDANIPTTVVLNDCGCFSGQEQETSAAIGRYSDMMDRLALLAEEDAHAPETKGVFSVELARIAVLSQRLELAVDKLLEACGQQDRPRRRAIQVLEALHPNVSLEIDGVSAKNTRLRGRCTIRAREQKLYFSGDRL